MKVKILKNESWRFFFFVESGQNYVFDCFTNKIYALNNELTELLENQRYLFIKIKYPDFYNKILKYQEVKPRRTNKKNERCIATINFSNNCNLNCKYCYRNKNDKNKMAKEDLESLVRFIKYDFMPEAADYCFSLCYTSESSLDLDYLLFFDSLIAKYEGYLFSKDKFSNNQITEIFNWLPIEIKNKYKIKSNYEILQTINQILQNEKLWKYFDYSKNSYLCELLKNSNELSLSKTVIANRQIIDDNFKLFNTKEKIKYMSMSFMTNATNITDEYIQFLKNSYVPSIFVSIDGKMDNHDLNRIYKNGKGSFSDVVNGIKKLQENGIKVKLSVVLTPGNTDVYEIVNYLLSLNVEQIGIVISRGSNFETSFSEDSINKIIKSLSKIYEVVFNEIKNERYKFFPVLKKNVWFTKVFDIYAHKIVSSRCNWGTEIIIDSQGNFYHCNSTIGNEKDLLGNWKKSIDENKLWHNKNVNDYESCKKCWTKYLCGGTCYAEELNEHQNNLNMECYYRKEFMKLVILFYAKLKRNNLVEKFVQEFLR